MKEETLFKISLICSLLGVLIILYISENTEIPSSNISNITDKDIETKVTIIGLVNSVKETPGLIILNVGDKTGNITVIAFKEENITIEKGRIIEIEGKVVEYNKQLEIQADSIIIKKLI